MMHPHFCFGYQRGEVLAKQKMREGKDLAATDHVKPLKAHTMKQAEIVTQYAHDPVLYREVSDHFRQNHPY